MHTNYLDYARREEGGGAKEQLLKCAGCFGVEGRGGPVAVVFGFGSGVRSGREDEGEGTTRKDAGRGAPPTPPHR